MSVRTRRRNTGSRPLGAVLAIVLLGSAAAFAARGEATAVPMLMPVPREWIVNGAFQQPLTSGWTCAGDVSVVDGVAVGRPGAYDYAGCSQQIEHTASYAFEATFSGSYAFVGVRGSGNEPEETYFWTNDTGPRTVQVQLRLKAGTTVYFHGWYGQGEYRVSKVSLIGALIPDDPSDPFGTKSPTPSPPPNPSPSPTPSCTPTYALHPTDSPD